MKRTIPPGTTNCIFCGDEPTTKEHVFSAWTHCYIKKQKGKWRGVVGEQTIAGGKQTAPIKGKGDIHDWQVKCVCENTCNNGWMRELENKARIILVPMIEGKQCRLSPQDQRVIAGWACLKAIVGEYEHPQMATWDQSARDRMKRYKLPPAKDCVIVIGRFPRVSHPMHWLLLPMLFLWGKKNHGRLGEPTSQYNSATTTQVIGQLLIHVIHAPKLPRILKRFNFTPSVTRKLRLVWPITSNHIDWPPDALTDVEADYVSGALYNHIDAMARRVLAARTAAKSAS